MFPDVLGAAALALALMLASLLLMQSAADFVLAQAALSDAALASGAVTALVFRRGLTC